MKSEGFLVVPLLQSHMLRTFLQRAVNQRQVTGIVKKKVGNIKLKQWAKIRHCGIPQNGSY